MNPLSQLLKLSAKATVGEARKLVADQVLSSMTSHPGREALLSALEGGPYEKKFGKRRGKNLTLLDEGLLLEEHHGMILHEARQELSKSLHEFVEDELESRPRYSLKGNRAEKVEFKTPEAMPPEWQPDLLAFFRTPESSFKKHVRELLQKQGYLTLEELSPEQLANLPVGPVEALDEDADEEDSEEDKD